METEAEKNNVQLVDSKKYISSWEYFSNIFHNHKSCLEDLEHIAYLISTGKAFNSTVSIDGILQKICVSPPYFAFRNIYDYKNALISEVKPEQEIGFEPGKISAAEASRHLAILGSCALSNLFDKKQYYLASKAEMVGSYLYHHRKIESIKLYAISLVLDLEPKRRKGTALNALVNHLGEPLFVFWVSYQIMPEKLFNKLFSEFRRETFSYENNPYLEAIKTENILMSENQVTSQLSKIGDKFCSGHFTGAPMIPVGIIAHTGIYGLKCFFEKVHSKNKKFQLMHAQMDVFYPMKPEATYLIKYQLNTLDNRNYTVSWSMEDHSGRCFNQIDMSFEEVNEFSGISEKQPIENYGELSI